MLRAIAVLAVGLAAFAGSAAPLWAEVEIEVTNGAKVSGTLLPADEREILRVQLPKGAQLSVTAKGKKTKGSAAPAVTFRVLDDGDDDISGGEVKPRGKTGAGLKKLGIGATGFYRVEVRSADGVAGKYEIKIKWKSPKKVVRDFPLAAAEVPIEIAVDAGASVSMLVKRGKGSAALPRLLRVEPKGGGNAVPIPQPDATATKHKAKGVSLAGGGDYEVIVGNGGDEGAAKATFKLKPPKSGTKRIDVTGAMVGASEGGDDRAVGTVIGPAGGVVAIDPGDASGLGGAAVAVPAGTLSRPTALVVGSAPAITDGPSEELRPAGPTVFFGPAGQTFDPPVEVTIPFNAAAFDGDFSSLVVVVRDAKGKESVVDAEYDVDVDAKTVSFLIHHFSAFRVFGRLATVPGDLNADGIGDFVYLDSSGQVGSINRVVVVFGGAGLTSRAIDGRDIAIAGPASVSSFGQALTIGDVNGDGVDDLVIGASEAENTVGRVYVFFGGDGFAGSTDVEQDADVVLRGNGGLARLGTAVAVGRLVGDATPDLVVGTNRDPIGGGTPQVFVYEGGAALVTGAQPAVTITGPSNKLFGFDVAVADVTGEGTPDLIIGSSFASASENGAIYVFAGGAGLRDAVHTDADVTLSGAADFERFGNALAVGDVTGDGAADIIGSTFRFGTLAEDVFVFAGGSGLADATTASADVAIRGDGTVTSDSFGSVLAAADLDGNGRDDLIIGDKFLAVGQGNPGAIAVYLGGPGLVSGGIAGADVVIAGAVDLDFFGSVLSAVDVSRDGVPDLIGIAGLNDDGGNNTGTAYVFFGGALPPTAASGADVKLTNLYD